MKRPELLVPIAAGLVAGSAHRQIARSLGCAPSTVTRIAARIGRHALLLQALALQHLETIEEPVVLDHFETFVFSQEDRLGIATPVGQKTWFTYGLDPAPHKLWRHSQAHQRRETIAFGRRSNALLERGFLFIVWRNFVKKVSERTAEAITPAMRLGLFSQALEWSQVFSQRLFPRRIRVPQGWMKVYRRGWITPAVGRNLPHALAHAF